MRFLAIPESSEEYKTLAGLYKVLFGVIIKSEADLNKWPPKFDTGLDFQYRNCYGRKVNKNVEISPPYINKDMPIILFSLIKSCHKPIKTFTDEVTKVNFKSFYDEFDKLFTKHDGLKLTKNNLKFLNAIKTVADEIYAQLNSNSDSSIAQKTTSGPAAGLPDRVSLNFCSKDFSFGIIKNKNIDATITFEQLIESAKDLFRHSALTTGELDCGTFNVKTWLENEFDELNLGSDHFYALMNPINFYDYVSFNVAGVGEHDKVLQNLDKLKPFRAPGSSDVLEVFKIEGIVDWDKLKNGSHRLKGKS